MLAEVQQPDLQRYAPQWYPFVKEELETRSPFLLDWFIRPWFETRTLAEKRMLLGKKLDELYHYPVSKNREEIHNFCELGGFGHAMIEICFQTGLITSQEIKAVLNGYNSPDSIANRESATKKCWTYGQVKEDAQYWSEQGLVIGMLSGSFDPAHIGHAVLGVKIKNHCDVIYAAVDSDSLIQARKGDDRPRIPALERMQDIAILPFVRAVCPISVPTIDEESYKQIYTDLRVGVTGCSDDNPLRGWLGVRMELLGGKLVTVPRITSSSIIWNYQ